MTIQKNKEKKIKMCLWVLRYEPKRFFKAFFWKKPWNGKRYLFDAFRYVWENPPVFDMEMERLFKYDKK